MPRLRRSAPVTNSTYPALQGHYQGHYLESSDLLDRFKNVNIVWKHGSNMKTLFRSFASWEPEYVWSSWSTRVSHFADIDEALRYLKEHMQADGMPFGSPDAAQYLGASGDGRVLLPLLDALQHGGAYIRASAALALGQLGRAEALPSLTQALVSDPGIYVRCDAALALGGLGREESIPVLLKRFASESFEVRKRIVMALGYFRHPMGEQALDALDAIEAMLDRTSATDGEHDFLQYLVEQSRLRLQEG
jgi:hypothetical protein